MSWKGTEKVAELAGVMSVGGAVRLFARVVQDYVPKRDGWPAPVIDTKGRWLLVPEYRADDPRAMVIEQAAKEGQGK